MKSCCARCGTPISEGYCGCPACGHYIALGETPLEKRVRELEERFEKAADKFENNVKDLDLASREELASFIKSVDGKIDGMVFAQFFFDMENPNNFEFGSKARRYLDDLKIGKDFDWDYITKW